MSDALLVPALVLAILCTWLAVPLLRKRKREVKLTAVALPMLYVLSFGPACWISSRTGRGANTVTAVYQPVFNIWWNGPRGIGRAVEWYARILSEDDWKLGGFSSWEYRWGRVLPKESCLPTAFSSAESKAAAEPNAG